jgi:hypothetical protein
MFVEKMFTNQRETHIVASADLTPLLTWKLSYLTILSRGPWDTSLTIQALSCRKKIAITKKCINIII